ncbi:MAG: flagellar motor switch protein FliM, partial [Thermoleophilia bacterium]|nr:flagellar motor switch protein FliM [Thermoleophilia bacterium]
MAEALSQSDIDSLLAMAAEHPAAGAGTVDAAATHAPGSAPLPLSRRSERQRYVRKMDFARPSKFNKDQLRTLQMLHESFCRRASTFLSGSVRSLVEVSVTGAEQIPYGDFVASLPVPTFTSVLEVSPLGTNAMASIDLPLLFAMIDRMLGGPGTNPARVRELTDIEAGLASNLMERLLDELSGAWGELVPIEFRLRGIEMNAQFAQIVPASEPSVLIIMELSIGTATGSLSICLPYRSIESVVGNLAAHRYFATGEHQPSNRAALLASLEKVTMPVRAEIGATNVPVETVLNLRPGDVVPLGRRVEEGVRLVVGSTRAYSALPGRDGGRVA